jgi:hypothetical protein
MSNQYQPKLKLVLFFVLFFFLFNIILNGFYLISLERPYFYYEYLALPLLFCYIPKNRIRVLVLGLVLLADAAISLAHFYFFDTVNYLRKLPSLFITHFPWYFWLVIIAGITIFIGGLTLFIKSKNVKQIGHIKSDKKTFSYFFVVSFSIIYFFDTLFGFSLLNFRPNNNFRVNIAKSIITEYYKDMKLYLKSYKSISHFNDFKNSNGDTLSISYKYLLADTSSHQVLIILESWGLLKDSSLRIQQIQFILDLEHKGYDIKFDSSYFKGGTSQAEARELLNKEGEAYYSIIQNGQLDIEGLTEHKNKAGYQTTALQSFSGFHSSGQRFRKILGFNTIKDYSDFKSPNLSNENYNNHYQAVNDETVFDYCFNNAFSHKKSFTYILTINTHLPFRSQKLKTGLFPTDETESQYKRVQEQFKHLANLLNKFQMDKVVIVGDHPPPFIYNTERNLYLKDFVPAFIITSKH